MLIYVAVLAACLSIVRSQKNSAFSPARPPAIPLAVKSPYLSAWLDAGSDSGGDGGYLAGQWPQFWANQIVGWCGLIRVDGVVKTWMGSPPSISLVNQTGFEYTSTTSSFFMNFDNTVELNVTFLSPLTPTDFMRQSLIFSYMEVSVASLDGKSHSVQVYSDISAEWISGDRNAVAVWEYGTVNDTSYHQISRQKQLLFGETSEQANWGNWYWATANSNNLSWQSGADSDVRTAFFNHGVLPNTNDTDFRAIQDNFPVFAFANDLGPVKGATKLVYSLGLTQDDAIQFNGDSGVVSVPSLWKSYFETDLDALSFAYSDYETARSLSSAFDNQVSIDSLSAGGQDYLTITSLSALQAFGAVQLCGTENKTYLFLKEIGSGSVTQTVDVIFPASPMLLYTNPTLLKLALDPIFENVEAGLWPKQFAIHDLGRYPNATGHTDGQAEAQPLEECGNMLIMTLAYAQRANDVKYLQSHYDILKQWTGFLVQEALIPASQISTDDFAGPLANQTNLALKGMIGIEAMAKIANLTNNSADFQNYSSIAADYIKQWQILGVATDATPPHTTLGYGLNDTHGLLYNLYADRLLSLDLVPQSIYDQQSAFYPTVIQKYGVPLDTRHNYTKSDWEMFTAAIASTSTQKLFISALANWINETPSNGAMTDLYDVQDGDYGKGITFKARPVVGGHFALLALKDVDSSGTWLKPTAPPTVAQASGGVDGSGTQTATGAATSSTAKKNQASSEKNKGREGEWKIWVGVTVVGVICGGLFLFDLQL